MRFRMFSLVFRMFQSVSAQRLSDIPPRRYKEKMLVKDPTFKSAALCFRLLASGIRTALRFKHKDSVKEHPEDTVRTT